MSQRRYKSGIDRSQETLFPPRLEDYISEHNPVRAIDAYIAGLDMEALGFTHNAPGRHQAGQPAYAPQMLLKLYLYGYLNRLRSSRTLERESQRNVELMWLLEGLQPSYKTIADFRKNNAQALRRTQAQFIVLCRALGLFGGQLVAVDGSFFKGNVSQKSFRTHRKLTAQMAKLEQELVQWHQALDAADREEAGEPASREERDLAEKLDALREALKEKTEALADLKQRGKSQHSPVDEDARLLSKRGQRVAGFNVQIVTDAQHKLIVADEVTNEPNDLNLLHPMSAQAKAALGVETLEVVADAGYLSSVQCHRCHEEEIYPYLPVPSARGRTVAPGRLSREAFVYEPEHDRYRCPEGYYLIASSKPKEQAGHWTQRYRSRRRDCCDCVRRAECLTAKGQVREIWRDQYEADTEAVRQRVMAHPERLAQRSELVEHPFGTLKRRAGWDHFLVRGLEKVRGEWSLMAWAYNFSRVLNLLGVKQFREICQRLAELLACIAHLLVLSACRFPLGSTWRLQVGNSR
ncbi:IS1182 family transposase [Pseudomonas sp. MYb185]|uniref:IS1182 family transposase n=1 Tax=Pseudomonas sp. MYb185 TaxID=1848729 RepID=UPI000CFC0644|nr:IS1182 family transposase [Pseudomonas sp. MYb185]PRB73779.1 transposase [Pseudomonas sp. MYb185]